MLSIIAGSPETGENGEGAKLDEGLVQESLEKNQGTRGARKRARRFGEQLVITRIITITFKTRFLESPHYRI